MRGLGQPSGGLFLVSAAFKASPQFPSIFTVSGFGPGLLAGFVRDSGGGLGELSVVFMWITCVKFQALDEVMVCRFIMRSMPTLEFKGVKFTGTFEECIAFADRFVPEEEIGTGPARPPAQQPLPLARNAAWPVPSGASGVVVTKPKRTDEVQAMALRFLKAIRDHRHTGGVTGEDLQQVLEVSHPKGVGSRIALINAYLQRSKLDPANIYTKRRYPDGARHWNAGPDLDSALTMLEIV